MSGKSNIKVTVITGFLGAGKTTFINDLLRKNHGTQFALVENEFGEVSIDTKLIKGVEASRMFELKQGCICCTITDEYELVLAELAERFPNVEHLLIETTGIADPASVIRPFFVDEILEKIYRYNGTICLVDAINFENSPEKDITIKQVVVSDLVLVSKSELISESQKQAFKENLRKINPFAEIEFTALIFASVKDLFKGLGVNSLLQKKKTIFNFAGLTNSHTDLSTRTLQFNKSLNKQEFIDWLYYNLDIYKKEIYRVKGILCFENEPCEFILQGVGGSFEIIEGDLILGEMLSKLVFIGNLKDINLEF